MTWTRRDVIKLTNSALLGGALSRVKVIALTQSPDGKGFVIGQPDAARVGTDFLNEGGNAIDAAVAAALAAGTVAPAACGIGGYGGHMMIARRGKVTAIDFNSAAPLAARADMFSLDANAAVKGEANLYGWLAAGVPGTLAGLQLAIDRYGTRPFRTLVQPAIRFAREGFPLREGQVNTIKTASLQLRKDPASARLLLKDGEPPQPGTTYRNLDLAAMLETLADAGSVAPFYRGAIARAIAAAFRKNGGLVTEKDLNDYRAHEVEPLEFSWRGYSVRTAPLTAGGATVLQALAMLRALGWERLEAESARDLHVRLEALRIAWDDRLRLFGDPQHVDVPLRRLLSTAYAEERAAQVDNAVRNGKRVAVESSGGSGGGTVHLSASDRDGNMVALTLTHGNPSVPA
jgi:gamma-glutamyltranspeptidase/glutathione hydrolase